MALIHGRSVPCGRVMAPDTQLLRVRLSKVLKRKAGHGTVPVQEGSDGPPPSSPSSSSSQPSPPSSSSPSQPQAVGTDHGSEAGFDRPDYPQSVLPVAGSFSGYDTEDSSGPETEDEMFVSEWRLHGP